MVKFSISFCIFILFITARNRLIITNAEDIANQDDYADEKEKDDEVQETTTKTIKIISEKEILNDIFEKYDHTVRPAGINESKHSFNNGPVVVTVNTYIRNIGKIDEINMEYRAQLTFRQEWLDKRLAYGEKFTSAEYQNLPQFIVLPVHYNYNHNNNMAIWRPDTFFQNEFEARKHTVDMPNMLIRIYPDGKILYSQRLTMVLSCPMRFNFFPFDTQICKIDLASYSYTTEDIRYEWKRNSPIQLKFGLQKNIPMFTLDDAFSSYCTSKTSTGEYSCLRAELILSRTALYGIKFYLPTFILVILSWLPFWFNGNNLGAKLTFGGTIFTTTIFVPLLIGIKMPAVSYPTFFDIWIWSCSAFTLCALARSVLVHIYSKKIPSFNITDGENGFAEKLLAAKENESKIDKFTKIGFPAFFVIFCIIYIFLVVTLYY